MFSKWTVMILRVKDVSILHVECRIGFISGGFYKFQPQRLFIVSGARFVAFRSLSGLRFRFIQSRSTLYFTNHRNSLLEKQREIRQIQFAELTFSRRLPPRTFPYCKDVPSYQFKKYGNHIHGRTRKGNGRQGA